MRCGPQCGQPLRGREPARCGVLSMNLEVERVHAACRGAVLRNGRAALFVLACLPSRVEFHHFDPKRVVPPGQVDAILVVLVEVQLHDALAQPDLCAFVDALHEREDRLRDRRSHSEVSFQQVCSRVALRHHRHRGDRRELDRLLLGVAHRGASVDVLLATCAEARRRAMHIARCVQGHKGRRQALHRASVELVVHGVAAHAAEVFCIAAALVTVLVVRVGLNRLNTLWCALLRDGVSAALARCLSSAVGLLVASLLAEVALACKLPVTASLAGSLGALRTLGLPFARGVIVPAVFCSMPDLAADLARLRAPLVDGPFLALSLALPAVDRIDLHGLRTAAVHRRQGARASLPPDDGLEDRSAHLLVAGAHVRWRRPKQVSHLIRRMRHDGAAFHVARDSLL